MRENKYVISKVLKDGARLASENYLNKTSLSPGELMGSDFPWKRADGVLMLHIEAELCGRERLKAGTEGFFF